MNVAAFLRAHDEEQVFQTAAVCFPSFQYKLELYPKVQIPHYPTWIMDSVRAQYVKPLCFSATSCHLFTLSAVAQF